MNPKRYRSYVAGAMVCAVFLTVSASEPGTAWDGQTQARDAGSRSGVGIGQMACRSFSESAKRLKSGDDDGLYYAFLAWRDGFFTAATSDNFQLTFALNHAEEWLGAYCHRNPQERFARAVATFVRQFRNARIAHIEDPSVAPLAETLIVEIETIRIPSSVCSSC